MLRWISSIGESCGGCLTVKSVGKFQEIIVYFANGLIFWFPARLDETLDHGVREDGIGSKATEEIGPCL